MMGSNPKFHRGTPLTSRVKRRRIHQYLPIVGVVLLVAVLILTASQNLNFVNLGYEITEIRDTNQALIIEQDKLRAELARLKRPDRVMREILAMGLKRVPPSMRYTIEVETRKPEPRPEPVTEAESERVLVALTETGP